jgi:hypothetical protein
VGVEWRDVDDVVMMLRRNISDWMERKERGKRCGFVARHVTIGTCCKRAIRIVTEGLRESSATKIHVHGRRTGHPRSVFDVDREADLDLSLRLP